jgi:DNA-binding MarR family transcriptional regulator
MSAAAGRLADRSPTLGIATPLSEPLDRLFAIAAVLGDAMEQDLAARGLSRARATVIWYLDQQGQMTQRQLADALAVTPRNVTGLVDALEKAGFVGRDPHPDDRRATLVTLSATGRRAAAAMRADRKRLADFLFADLDPTDRSALGAALDRVLARLADPELDRIRRRARRRWSTTTVNRGGHG